LFASPLALLLVIIGLVPLLVACAPGAPAGKNADPFAGAPLLLREAPASVREAYQYALDFPDELAQVPCFCGCEEAGHRNVRDCFVKEIKSDGSVAWDMMGAG
jgi:hypothetical protein